MNRLKIDVYILLVVLLVSCNTYKILPLDESELPVQDYVTYDSTLKRFRRCSPALGLILPVIVVDKFILTNTELVVKGFVSRRTIRFNETGKDSSYALTPIVSDEIVTGYKIYLCGDENGKLLIKDKILQNKKKFTMKFDNSSTFYVLYLEDKNIGEVYSSREIFEDIRTR